MCVYVCLVAMNSIILLWVISIVKELQCQLHSIVDKNLSTVRGWTFGKFYSKEKKMSSVGVLTQKKSKCSVWGKKNLSVREKKFKVWRKRKKCKCRISGVRKKMKLGKMIVVVKFELNHIWARCCKTWAKKWKVNLRFLRELKSGFFWVLLGLYPLVGRHVVNEPLEPEVGCHVVTESKKIT